MSAATRMLSRVTLISTGAQTARTLQAADLLAAEGVPERTVFHCFTGGADEARRCLDLGATLSFSGIVTFRKWDDLALLRHVPADRLLVETDAPYLAPVPHRGRTNTPAFVPLATKAVVKGIEAREVDHAHLRPLLTTERVGP